MNRCLPKRALLALAFCLALGASLLWLPPAQAQGIIRDVPRDVVLGQMTVGLAPQITMDGKPERLSPGARIRDLNNMQVLSAGLSGQQVPVVYKRDPTGLVHEVWILTPDEYKKLAGTMPGARGGGVQQFLDMLVMIFGGRR